MFRNAFQGGKSVEVLNPSNKDLMSSWFISKHVKKEFDKTANTFAYFLKGESAVQQMAIPKDKKMSLGLQQYYLVVQIFVSVDQRFSLEVRITCKSGCTKRISFSSHKENVQLTPLFAVVPLNVYHKNRWVHLCINLADVISELWHEEYKSIESICLSGNCKIRQIYTVSENIIEQENCRSWEDRYRENLPRRHQFPVNIVQGSQLICKTYISHCIKSTSVKKSSTSSSTKSLLSTSTPSKSETSCFLASNGNLCQQSIGQAFLRPKPKKPSVIVHSVEDGRNPSRPASCCSQRNASTMTKVTVVSEPPKIISCSNTSDISHEKNFSSIIPYFSGFGVVREVPASTRNLSASSRSISSSGSEGSSRGIADLLPRYKNSDACMPQLSPVSNALSLARAITRSNGIENDCNENLNGKSLSEMWKENQQKQGSGSSIYNGSVASLCKEHQKMKDKYLEYEPGSLCSFHQQLHEGGIQRTGSSSQVSLGRNGTTRTPTGLFSAEFENANSNVDMNLTRSLDSSSGGPSDEEDAAFHADASTALGRVPLPLQLNKTFTL